MEYLDILNKFLCNILQFLNTGAKQNIHGESYPAEWQNFDIMHGQIWRLDAWVFDKYIDWLREESWAIKNTERIVLFLHLLGCDTTGHAAKPYSRYWKFANLYLRYKS